jgi:ABC-type nitrate/sulfonate/bicarbonate transport system substrate-binding protein
MKIKGPITRRDCLELGGLAAASLVLGPSMIQRAFAEQDGMLSATIANSSGNVSMTFQELIRSQGYFDQLKLNGTHVNIADGSKIVPALLSGQADISVIGGIPQVFPAIEKGAKLKIVAGCILKGAMAVYSRDPTIKSVKDLEGRTFGVGALGSLLHLVMVGLMHKKGVDPGKVTFVNVGSSTDVFRAVVAGTVDAGVAQYDVYDEQAKYGVHSLTDGDFWKELPEFTYQAAYASDDAIANKREALIRVLEGYARLFAFISSPGSRDAFIKASMSQMSGSDPKQAEANGISLWKFLNNNQVFDLDLLVDAERMRYMQQLNVDLGVQQKVLPFEQVADMSLAREAIARIGKA